MGQVIRGAAAVAAAGAACVAYGTFVERRWFRLRRETIAGPLRGPGALRVLLVADTHLHPPERALSRFVERLAEHEVDLVVAAGDLIGATGAEDATVELLAPLVADGTPGIAVLGSNDHFAPQAKNPFVYFLDPDRQVHGPPLDTDRFRQGLRDSGWQVLENARVTVETGAGPVHVAGLPDPHLRTARMPRPQEIAVPGDDAVLHLGLVHAPYSRALDLLSAAGYDLLLCGHTHGGQVRFPPFGALTTNSDLPTDRARGTSRHDGAWLHVTAGLGQSRYAPFRFACRPEASLLTVTG
ncbi:MAG: metallophosphoesterase [Actinobacteria bacterium]|nr:metallophosphoesterase [Actinomycetota bacterium]